MDAVYFEAPAPGGSRPPKRGESGGRPSPEPIVNAPAPVVVLTLSIIGLYAVQSRFPAAEHAFAFSPLALQKGHAAGLLTSLFIHGNWAHALMNAAFILAFGAPVARFFGPSGKGAAGFFAFYFLCGVLAGLGFAALHWNQPVSIIGASGAASGLMGAAARLIAGHGRVGPIMSPAVGSMALAWLIVNIIMAFAGGLLIPGSGDAPVGWEAHLAGFAAGVVLIRPIGWIFGRR